MKGHLELVGEYERSIGVEPSAVTSCPEPGARLAATLPVWALAAGSVATVGAALDRLRTALGLPVRPVHLDPDRVTAAFASDRVYRENGETPRAFAELSGFFAARDGWVRTHANYPHHRARLLTAFQLPESTTADELGACFADLPAQEIERRAVAVGAIAAAVRTESEWAATEPGRFAAQGPLVRWTPRTTLPLGTPGQEDGEAAARAATTPTTPDATDATATASAITAGRWLPRTNPTVDRPLGRVRVLDLTRVLAGPVATRTLALFGADVLRIDPPHLPEIGFQFRDTCQGKRSAIVDLRENPALLNALLAEADVLVTGYRPGALATLGVHPDRHPHLITASVSAWGTTGPWGERRGFDSIVQAASGIALIEGAGRPGALPTQALDHASGYLLVAAVIDALRARNTDGISYDVAVALARTAAWLLAHPTRTPNHPPATPPTPSATVTHGDLTTATPAFAEHADYPHPAPGYGSTALI
ncbi:CoA transferase [Nocardia camponoti]|uniref:CoA transferase n=1 Tax=Nocardia camponoti TaxID=1616106 RepID=UPI001E4C43C3|nr:CoA transferase [Nocardia camponoti]